MLTMETRTMKTQFHFAGGTLMQVRARQISVIAMAVLVAGRLAPPALALLIVNRQVNGATIGFTWALNEGIEPGTVAPFLYILTNASGYDSGGIVSLMNGAVASVGVYRPISVPEPMSLLLAGSGIVAVGLFWRKGRKYVRQGEDDPTA